MNQKLEDTIVFIIVFIGVIGWIANFATVINQVGGTEPINSTGEFAVRFIGLLFVPLGAIMGYM